MADNNSWELISPLAGTTVTGNTSGLQLLDERITQANNALTWLKSHVDSQTTKSAIIRHNVPIYDTVEKGDLVYYNAGESKYYKAQALLLPESTVGGRTIEAPEARVEGIIIDTYEGSSGVVGTMLCGGYWNDDYVTNACLIPPTDPNEDMAGVYYLSPSEPGKATKETGGHLRQPVLSYYGDGAGFSLSIFYMAHDNHFHASQILNANWAPATGSDKPDGAQYVFHGDISMGLGTLGDTTAVFYKGELQVPYGGSTYGQQFVISGNKLYCMMAIPPLAGEVVVFNHYPFAYENAIIRSVYSDSNSLTVENTNGIIKLTANDFIAGNINPSAYAVSSIQDNQINFTPIVAHLYPGPGINVATALDGGVFVSSAALIGGLIDAYNINHNGTTMVSAGSLEYVTFQARRASNFVMTAPIKGITADCNVSVWAMKRGTTAANLQLEVSFIPDPVSGTAGTVEVVSQTATLPLNAATSATALTYGEVTISGLTVGTDGLLVAKVSADNPSEQIMLLREGFKLSVDTTATVTAGDTAVDTSKSIRQQMTAGEALNAGDAVYVQNSKLFKCYNSIGGNDTTNLCVGIVEVGAAANALATYVVTGAMLCSDAPGQSGDSLYIGKNGHIRIITGDGEDTVDNFLDSHNVEYGQARYLQKVGTVLATGVIQVNVESAIRSAVL